MINFSQIAYYSLLGQPFIIWLGILTYLCLVFTASISILNKKGVRKIPFSWHKSMAIITLILATLHGLLILLAKY